MGAIYWWAEILKHSTIHYKGAGINGIKRNRYYG